MRIDLVYLWVDGADPVWQKRKLSHLNDVNQDDRETFSEARSVNSDELRYSLRSVEMYAPWINHIYIVTDGQQPKWLDTQNPKITIVDHKELFPAEVLPLYNSVAIELGIHRIKGLSEHYLYANDDMMFGKAVSPELFFTPEGVAKCYFIKSRRLSKPNALNSTYNTTVKKAIDTITHDYGLNCANWVPYHQISAYTKSSVERSLQKYKEWSDATISNRFRTRDDMQRHILSLYAVAMGDGVAIIEKLPKLLGIRASLHKFLGITSNVKSLCLALHKTTTLPRLKHIRPSLLCINDTPQTTFNDRAETVDLLEEIYPQRSQFEKKIIDPLKVDLVYLWVDGSDIEWQRRQAKYLHGLDQIDSESFCDGRAADNDELLYSLRSVGMYAPWINHIYIVTDGQCPKWLDTQNPKISIVDHKEILPPDAMPTFNSCAIELAIHRIKGLSECYLYANDDMMFGRELSPNFFFTPEGKPKCRFNTSKRLRLEDSRLGTHMCSVKNVTNIIKNDLGLNCGSWSTHHQIDPYNKSSVAKCIETYKEWSEETIHNRFRTRYDMQRHILSLYAVATGDGVVALINIKKRGKKIDRAIKKLAIFLGLDKGVTSLYIAINKRHIKNKIRNYKPALICFNDTEKVNNENRDNIKKLFQEIYPIKSKFEK
ncbi:MAG: Stealth CR1 domain-containing protein [Rikenellaceae bacterium]